MLPTEADEQIKETPRKALKDFGGLAAVALVLAWVPAVAEALLATALVRYLTSYIDGVKRWRAPIRVPADLGATGYRDATTSKRGDGTFLVGIDTVPTRRAEIWLSPSDLLGGRLVVAEQSARRAEWLATVANALRSGAGFFILDRHARTEDRAALTELAESYGAETDVLAESLTARMNVVLCDGPDATSAIRILTAAIAPDPDTAGYRFIAALLPALAWVRQRQGGPLDTETLYASLSLPVLENLAFFGRYGGGAGGPVDLRATDQAAAAELDALTAPLRSLLAGLPNYTRPGTARDHSVPGFTPDSDLHRAVLSAFDALVAGLRVALEAIRGPNATNPRVVLDLACLSVLLRQGRSVHVTAAEAGPTVLRLFACALADALASLPPRDLVARGRITDAQPLFLILDGFEDYAVPGLLPTELAKRGIALTVGLSGLGRLSQASESLARDLWSDTDIHVADRAALEERALAVAVETDLAMNATREHIEAVPALLEPRDARFLLTMRDRRVVSDQGTAMTALHLLAYAPAGAQPQPEPAPGTAPSKRRTGLFRSHASSPGPSEPALR